MTPPGATHTAHGDYYLLLCGEWFKWDRIQMGWMLQAKMPTGASSIMLSIAA